MEDRKFTNVYIAYFRDDTAKAYWSDTERAEDIEKIEKEEGEEWVERCEDFFLSELEDENTEYIFERKAAMERGIIKR